MVVRVARAAGQTGREGLCFRLGERFQVGGAHVAGHDAGIGVEGHAQQARARVFGLQTEHHAALFGGEYDRARVGGAIDGGLFGAHAVIIIGNGLGNRLVVRLRGFFRLDRVGPGNLFRVVGRFRFRRVLRDGFGGLLGLNGDFPRVHGVLRRFVLGSLHGGSLAALGCARRFGSALLDGGGRFRRAGRFNDGFGRLDDFLHHGFGKHRG